MLKKRKKAMPNSLIVTQANELVEARYNLPLGEQRLILTMLSRIQPNDEDFKEYRISMNDFAEFMEVDKNHVYAECKQTTAKLMTRGLSIQEKGRLLQANWVSSADYVDGEGCVKLCFDPKLKPYLLQLKSNFTSCKLNMLLSFKSQYTMRIYTLLKQYQKLKEREIELNLLRDMLGISKNLHVEYRDFKRHVIIAAQKELAQKSDLTFEFEEIKYGRRVGAILFYISARELPVALSDLDEARESETTTHSAPSFLHVNLPSTPVIDNLLLLVPERYRNRKNVLAVIIEFEKKEGFEYVRRNILYCNTKADKSYGGFLSTALKEDWGHDWQLEQQQPVKVKPKVPEVWERQGFKTQKEYDMFMFARQMERYGQKTVFNE